MKKITITLFIIAFMLHFTAVKAQFGGGEGTEVNPYWIVTATHLNNIKLKDDEGRYLYLNNAFIQGANIDLDVAPYNEGMGWEPIGNKDFPFNGTYDGNDYSISNLFINRPLEDSLGLFGVTSGANLIDIELLNVSVTGNNFVGALVGSFRSSSVNEFDWVRAQTFSTGSVSGNHQVGGLIGYSDNGALWMCYSTCTVDGADNVGGLIGKADESDISKCYSQNAVTGNGDNVGGLIGMAYESEISNCFSDCNVLMDGSGSLTGGLVGYLYSNSIIVNCYSVGVVDGEGSSGGLTGYNHGSEITNSYAASLVTGSGGYVGGLAGRSDGTINTSYWDMEISGIGEPGLGDGRTTEEMTYPYAINTYEDWNFSTVWVEDPDIGFGYFNNGYPYLDWQHNPQQYGFGGGSGTEADPYLVATAAHLNSVRNEPEAWFLQTANIDLGVAPWNVDEGWKPIGENTASGKFVGHYNGDNYSIQNMTINKTSDYLGLFGYLKNAEINNVILENIQVTARDYAGSLAGKAENEDITNCSVSGNLSGRYYNGGLAGEIISETSVLNCETDVVVLGVEYAGGMIGQSTSSEITGCFAAGDVETTGNYVGGLVAYTVATDVLRCSATGNVDGFTSTGGLIGIQSESTVAQCFTTGNITGTQYTGGLVGFNWNNSSVTDSYSRSQVSGGSSYLGGLVGYNPSGNSIVNCFSTGIVNGLTATQGLIGQGGGTVVDCFWDTEASGDSGSSGGGVGLTTVEMKNLSSFTDESLVSLTTAWDFVGNPVSDIAGNDRWDIDGTLNDGYPFLSWQKGRIVWNGGESNDPGVGANWSSGSAPLAGDNILVVSTATNNLVVNRTPALPQFYNSLLIENGASVEIAAGKALTISGYLHNEGALEIISDATGTGSLIQYNSGVEATIGRYMTGGWESWDAGWHNISSPVQSQSVADFITGGEGNGYDFFGWDETTNTWMNQKEDGFNAWNGGANFNTGQGYMISYQQTQSEIAFEGKLNIGDLSISDLSFTEDEGNGWHLLGNPFGSPLIWNDENWTLDNVAGVAKIWNEVAKSYADIGAGGIIPQAQGFFVQVNEEDNSLVIPAASRSHDSQPWYKAGENDVIILVAGESNGNSFQETKIIIHPDASENFDFEYDSRFLPGFAPQFYSVVEAEKLSTNSLPALNEETVIPLSFLKNQNSNFSIQLKQTIESLTLILVDQQNGIHHHLSQNPTYIFSAAASDRPDRFLLNFGTVGIEQYQKSSSLQVFSVGKTITILNPDTFKGTVRIFNTVGQEIKSQAINGEAHLNIQTNVSAGVYIVNIAFAEGAIKKKIIIQ